MARGNASVRRVGVYASHRFDVLRVTGGGAIQQAVGGTLTMAATVATAVRTPLALAGTLTMAGVLTPVLSTVVSLAGTLTMASTLGAALRAVIALAGTLTASAVLGTTYSPPSSDGDLTTLLRRNQTD